jgi:hypothetical protein
MTDPSRPFPSPDGYPAQHPQAGPPPQYQPQPGQYQPQPGQYQPQPGPYQPQPGPYQPQPGPYQPQPGPYQPQPGPFPPPYQAQPAGAPPPRRRGRGWIIFGVIAAVVLVLCVGGVAVVLFASDGAKDKKPTTASNNRYNNPPDRCTLLDASMVDGWAGTTQYNSADKSSFPDNLGGSVDGCSFVQRLAELNTLSIYVATDGHAAGRYDYTLKAYKAFNQAFVIKPVAGLGSAASSLVFQQAEKRKIQASVFLQDGTLFLEVRFNAGGTEPWNPDEVVGHLTDVSRAILAKLRQA